ncbi:MAG: HEAT repeat domain-containing protein [Campylobacterales bacterium]|nr:HEAT repeat domain-containing protein [Campylobacterales bacterium]MBE0499528.1 HEAT repeat domain-containing protein [Campylobacterales bacterium]
MALIKRDYRSEQEELPEFQSLEEAIIFYENTDAFDKRSYAIEEMVKFKGGGRFLVDKLIEHDTHKDTASRIAAVLSNMDPEKAPIEEVMELLKLQNAYVRNLGISILQDYGEAIRYYIVKFLIGDDYDLRIFAINVLGDVNFAQSRDMLVELLENEQKINVAMTAIDYMAEIGQPEDVPLLRRVKERFKDDSYAQFAIDAAIESIEA